MAGIIKVNQYQDFNGNTLFTSDGNGNLTTQEIMYPAFEAYLSGNQTVSDGVDTKITYNAEYYDTHNAFDSTTNYRFICPSGGAGKYYVYHQVRSFLTTSSINFTRCAIMLNGTKVRDSGSNFEANPAAGVTVVCHSVITLTEGDYIEGLGQINVTSGSGYFRGDDPAYCRFGAYRIGS